MCSACVFLWFLHVSISPEWSCILERRCLTYFILWGEALLSWLQLLDRESDAHCVVLAKRVRATCQGGVVPTHNTTCQFQGGGDARRWVVKRVAGIMRCFFWKIFPLENSAKSKARASLKGSHLLALVGVSTDKYLSISECIFLFHHPRPRAPCTPLIFASVYLSDWIILDGRGIETREMFSRPVSIKFWIINCWCFLCCVIILEQVVF